MDPLCQKSKKHYNKIAKCERSVENLRDEVAKCEPFRSGKIAQFGYDFTTRFGGQFYHVEKLHSMNRHLGYIHARLLLANTSGASLIPYLTSYVTLCLT